MSLALLEPELREAQQRLERASAEEHAAAIVKLSTSLAKSIKEGTVTLDEIDAFLVQTPKVPSELMQFLLSEKASLLLRQGLGEEALHYYDKALEINEESPSPWAAKAMALMELQRVDEAFQAFQKAYLHRESFGQQKQGHLENLFNAWSTTALLLGLTGILEQNPKALQKGVEEYLEVLEKAGTENLKHAVLNLGFQEPVPQELRDALEELEVAVKLLSIKDPFDRWRAFTAEISKVWPEGVSVVDAIREERDHEWNTWS